MICLSLLPFLAIPLFLVGGGPLAPVDHNAPVGVQSVEGQASYAPSTERDGSTSSVDPTTTTTTTTIAAPTTTAPVTTTTTAPVIRAARKPTAAPTTTEPVAVTAPPATTAPKPAPTAPPAPPTTAPKPAPTAPQPVVVAPTTTAAPRPAPPRNRQSGQATWYRWRKGNCAHNSLPMGTRVTVTAVATGKSTTCVVGDRGGFRNPTIIDLDASVFEKIAPLGAGRIAVSISW